MCKDSRCYCAAVQDFLAMKSYEIAGHLKEITKGHTSESEYQSWCRSLPILLGVLHRAGMDRLSLALEYETPLGKRIDAVLLGEGRVTHRPLALIIELKQWSFIGENTKGKETFVRVCISPKEKLFEDREHPVQQTLTYKKHLKRNHSNVSSGKIDVLCCQFLHNFEQKEQLFEGNYSDYAFLKKETYVKGEEEKLEAFLRDTFSSSPNQEAVDLFLNGEYVFGSCDYEALRSVNEGKENAVMIDEQKEINKRVYKILEQLKEDPSHRELVVISGAPGTGKTVIGLHMLWLYGIIFEKTRQHGLKCVFSMPRSRTLAQVIQGASHIPIVYLENIAAGMDMAVIDEAHRIERLDETMRTLFTKAKIVVVLQDDHQRVRLSEEGTVENFVRFAGREGIACETFCLTVQKRLQYLSNYVQCLHKLLYERYDAPIPECDGIELICWDSLLGLDKYLHQMQENKKHVKWYAPFCWPWSRDAQKKDISIQTDEGTFEKPWNPEHGQYEWYQGARESDLDQVGCIYTAHGLQFEHTGLIWWDDLRWNEARSDWEIDLNASQDWQFIRSIVEFYGGKLASDKSPWQVRDGGTVWDIYTFLQRRGADMDAIKELVLNTYWVLLTRALKGVSIWFKDNATAEHFRKVMGAQIWHPGNTER